jgi:hypothetical protein
VVPSKQQEWATETIARRETRREEMEILMNEKDSLLVIVMLIVMGMIVGGRTIEMKEMKVVKEKLWKEVLVNYAHKVYLFEIFPIVWPLVRFVVWWRSMARSGMFIFPSTTTLGDQEALLLLNFLMPVMLGKSPPPSSHLLWFFFS